MPEATGQLRQFRADRVLEVVEVTVTARVALQVTQVQLRLAGFGETPARAVDVRIPADGIIDLPASHGRADCALQPGGATATLTVRQADGSSGTVDLDLVDDGLVGRLHTDACAATALRDAVDLRVDAVWSESIVDDVPTLRGTLRLTRRTPGPTIVLEELGANILLSVRTDRITAPLLVLDPDQQVATLPLILAPARCDPHALTESKRTSLINVYIGVGGNQPRLAAITPDQASRDRIEAFALAGCRTIAGR